jgi:hypothetical protein
MLFRSSITPTPTDQLVAWLSMPGYFTVCRTAATKIEHTWSSHGERVNMSRLLIVFENSGVVSRTFVGLRLFIVSM